MEEIGRPPASVCRKMEQPVSEAAEKGLTNKPLQVVYSKPLSIGLAITSNLNTLPDSLI